MEKFISNKNILFNIIKYLPLKDINSIQRLNKNIYQNFNPEKMLQLNLLYLSEFYKVFYDEEAKRFCFSSDYNNYFSQKNLLVTFNESGINWQRNFRDFNSHINSCKFPDEGKKVIDFFKSHLFLPDLIIISRVRFVEKNKRAYSHSRA